MMKKELKKEVQKQLWRLGKKVRDMAGIPGVKYDLLVDEKIRVCIGEGNVDCDIIAREIKGKKMYAKNHWHSLDSALEWKSPTKVFGVKEE